MELKTIEKLNETKSPFFKTSVKQIKKINKDELREDTKPQFQE